MDSSPQAYAASVPGAAEAAVVPVPPTRQATGAATPPASPRRAAAALVALAAAAFLVVTNEVLPLGIIKLVAADLGRSESEVGLTTTVFALTVALFTMPLTFATTRLPRRPLVAVTVAFWSVGAVVQATADSYGQLMAGRVMTGLGHALFWAVVTPAAASMFAAENRGKSVSRLLLGASAAGVVGLPAATWLAQRTDWQTPFWVLGAAGAVVAIAIAILMPTFRTEEGTVARGELPSLRRYLRILVITLLTVGSMAVTWTFVTPFFTDVAGFAESSMPVLLGVGGVVGLISMWLVGRYLDRWPVKSAVLGLALLAAVWAGFAVLGAVKPVAVAVLLVHGFTWSIIVASLVNWALRHTTWTSDIGNAAYASTFNLGNVLGSSLGAGLLAWHGARWLPAASFVLVAAALAIAWGVRPRGVARR